MINAIPSYQMGKKKEKKKLSGRAKLQATSSAGETGGLCWLLAGVILQRALGHH